MTNPEQNGEIEKPSHIIEDIDNEKKTSKMSRKTKIAIAAVAVAAVAFAGGFATEYSKIMAPFAAETPSDPVKDTENTVEVPSEVKSFVELSGSTYADPASTYYAEKAYELSGNKSLILSSETINDYDTSLQNTETGAIVGFERYQFSLDSEINQNNSIGIFNEYTARELALYINALAKNPNSEAQAVIDAEFIAYCSGTESIDDQYIQNLMSTCKLISAKYGSNTNFEIGKGINYEDPRGTYINDLVHVQGEDENGKAKQFSSSTNLLLKISTYNNEIATESTAVISNLQLLYTRQQSSAYLSIGQIGQVEIAN